MGCVWYCSYNTRQPMGMRVVRPFSNLRQPVLGTTSQSWTGDALKLQTDTGHILMKDKGHHGALA